MVYIHLDGILCGTLIIVLIQNEKRALVGFLTEVQTFSVALPLSRKGQMMYPRVSDTLLIKSLDDIYLLDESLQ